MPDWEQKCIELESKLIQERIHHTALLEDMKDRVLKLEKALDDVIKSGCLNKWLGDRFETNEETKERILGNNE